MAGADVIDYKVEKFQAMGFDYMQSLVLTHARDPNGVPLYWRDVEALTERVGLLWAYDFLT